MFLNRIHLDTRCREARRDLSDPYQLHSTLCRAFCKPDVKCPQGHFLWRLEPETDVAGNPRILVQSKDMPDWAGIGIHGWLAEAGTPIDLEDRLKLESLKAGQRFRFRLRANPCVTRNGKRIGLLRLEEQEKWLKQKGEQHGFSLHRAEAFLFSESEERVEVRISQEQMLSGHQHSGNGIRIFSVLYDGVLSVANKDLLKKTLITGIGHGKAMGLGMLSVAPIG